MKKINNQVNIRKYQDSDRQALIELWETVFLDDPPHNQPDRVIDLKLANDDMILVAESNHTLIGSCLAGYDGHRGWLNAVAVQPKFQRRGVGELLVIRAMGILKELGCIKVNLQIRPSNIEVIKFYQSLGFEIEERVNMGRLLI